MSAYRARPIFAAAAVAAAIAGAMYARPLAQSADQPKSNSKSVAIERLALHQFEDGPLLDSGYVFVPGETAYFSCRIAAYQIIRKDEDQRVKLAWQMSIVDPLGVPIVKDQSGRIEDHVLPQDKKWIPKFLSSFMIPAFAPSGTYRVTVKIKDEAGNTETMGELPFQVHGHSVEASDKLIARNFQFLKNENDRGAMTAAIYHPGETLWARFDITGFKLGGGNHFDVAYGLAVLKPTGEQVFAQPEAASESKDSFYPQRYVPGSISLNLDPNVPKGSYVLLIAVHDKVGGESWETRQPFEIQ